MLRTILCAFGRTHAAVASYNNHWGLPLTLARMPLDSEFCVAEIGMNHAGEIAPLARLARPHVAVITAVEKAHIGFLGSIEAIADEKAAILRALEPGGVAVLPADSPLLPRLRAAAGDARVVTFGAAPDADVRLVGLAMDADGSDVVADVEGERAGFRLNAPGRHMAMNALAALAAARHLADRAARDGAMALEDFAPVTGRGARRQIAVPGGTALLLDESYNGNPASMRAALEVLRLQPARRRIAVLGDMLELGEAGPDEHRALAADVAAAADCLFACGPLMQELFAAVPAAIRGAHRRRLGIARADRCALHRAGRRHPDQGQPRQPDEAGGQRTRTTRGGRLMLYDLARPLANQFILFNLLRYITFRSGAACLTALIVSFILGPPLIRWLRSLQGNGQPIRTDGPERHLIEKKGTPTMGGVLILSALTISTLLWVDLRNGYVWAVLFVTLGYGALGFADDYRKLSRQNHKGVSARIKLIAQTLIGIAAAIWIMHADARSARHVADRPGVQGRADPARLSVPDLRHAGDARCLERGEPDRRAGRAGHRADHHLRRRVRADRLPGRQPHLRGLPAAQPGARASANWRCSAPR